MTLEFPLALHFAPNLSPCKVVSDRILLRKTSLVDYPGRVSSVFFFSGCNLRCPWCHNRELVSGGAGGLVSVDEGLAHIKKRRSVLGGVVLSGGEPCLQEDLPLYISEIKKLTLPVKLDTNGTFPAMLEKLFSREETRPDYIALDLKISPARYRELCNNSEQMHDKLIQSAELIRESGIAHEYRTLALPSVLRPSVLRPGAYITESDIEALAPLADNAPWYFRAFRGGNCLDSAWDSLEENENDAQTKVEALARKARDLGKKGVTNETHFALHRT